MTCCATMACSIVGLRRRHAVFEPMQYGRLAGSCGLRGFADVKALIAVRSTVRPPTSRSRFDHFQFAATKPCRHTETQATLTYQAAYYPCLSGGRVVRWKCAGVESFSVEPCRASDSATVPFVLYPQRTCDRGERRTLPEVALHLPRDNRLTAPRCHEPAGAGKGQLRW